MAPLMSATSHGETSRHRSRVVVRYWAAARDAAGRTEDHVEAATVDEALTAVLALHRDSPRFARVLGIASLLVGDRPVRQDRAATPLTEGDVIEVLPPFAGG